MQIANSDSVCGDSAQYPCTLDSKFPPYMTWILQSTIPSFTRITSRVAKSTKNLVRKRFHTGLPTCGGQKHCRRMPSRVQSPCQRSPCTLPSQHQTAGDGGRCGKSQASNGQNGRGCVIVSIFPLREDKGQEDVWENGRVWVRERQGRRACNLGAERVQKASQVCNHRLEILSTVQVDPLHAPKGFLRVSLILDPITPRQVAPLCNHEHAQHLRMGGHARGSASRIPKLDSWFCLAISQSEIAKESA
jgi:hypothetical protein